MCEYCLLDDAPDHLQVLIEHPHPKRNDSAMVDEDIADVILALWAAGLWTVQSCQDNFPDGYVWIHFSCSPHAHMFIERVVGEFDSRPGTLWSRVYGDTEDGRWLVNAQLVDMNAWWDVGDDPNDDGGWFEDPEDKPEPVIEVHVRFPRADLPAVRSAYGV